MPKFRKKAVVVEARQWTADDELGGPWGPDTWPDWLVDASLKANDEPGALYRDDTDGHWYIHTLEGDHRVTVDAWIIRGVAGEMYPCMPDIFNATYEPAKSGMSFGGALEVLKEGGRVTRPSWNGTGMWVELQRPDEHSKMGRPYLYMSHADGILGPWNATQSDMLAEDWEVVE